MTRFSIWRRALAVAAVFAVVLLLGSGAALAQQQAGNVFGTVTDDQGSRLPGVTVTLSGAGAPIIQVTDERGQFRFPGLTPGRYQVSAQLEGFSAVDYPNVQVNIGRNTDLQITLTPALEETITVTSESPLLDERKMAAGTTVSQIELEKIPTARDPWAILTQSPGVMSDRINVGGNESGQQAVFSAGGQSSDENTFAVDGVVITDLAATGSSPTYYDFDQFEEMQVSTGGSDITAITGGVTMNLVTKRGTNEPRGSARYFLTDADKMLGLFEEADPDIADELAPGQTAVGAGNRINEIVDYGFEAGGPIVQDRLWLWGSYGRNDIKQFVASGAADNTLLENSALKLNGQLATNNSAVVSFNRGDKIKTGRNAGRTRPVETTWNQTGPTELWKAEDTHIFSSNFYLTGLFSFVDGGFALRPNAGQGPEAFWDANGIWRNSFQGGASDRNTTNYQLDGSY
ncbi:MAG TPA: carboxypeptidase regulatory-like domain-containing protein, partial [Solirubrobacterales bacterium]